ncbi:MAG: hypothetical protein H6575_06550 [Lewinellaceae bacterium]|nr:hypothetical protein [Lewinellaceae bacterium]
MSWKKTILYFTWQSVRYAHSWSHFMQIWSYRERWQQSFNPGRNSVADALPWINFPALEFLERHLRPENIVFEFGGGGSTLFFCKNVAEVATVEDHPEWFDILTKTVKAQGWQNWKGYMVPAEDLPEGQTAGAPQDPAAFSSNAKGMEQKSFEKYARTINQYPGEYFDLVLVDGRARPACINQALPHLKKGGYLVVDNTERAYYLAAFHELIREQFEVETDMFAPVAYTPDFTKTTILRKKR